MIKKFGKVLAIDDNEDILFALKLLLKPYVEQVVTTSNPNEIPRLMEKDSFDLFLLDMGAV